MEPGDLVDRYRVEGPLGQGGMAAVWLVRHEVLGSRHALKVLHAELVADDELRERFLGEGRILAQLRHPNLVAVTDVVAEPGIAGLVMEYVEGPTLEAWLSGRGPVGLDEIREILLPILDGVGAAHARGIVHRDLKPSNVIVGRLASGRARPVVLDFGIARIADEAAVRHDRKRRTRSGARMGTLHYMSPEQLASVDAVDARTDIFALGAVLYELATGRVAFDGTTEYDTMRRIVEVDPVVPPDVGIVDPALRAVVSRALARDPADRFPDCAAFAAALAAARVVEVVERAGRAQEALERRRGALSRASEGAAAVAREGVASHAAVALAERRGWVAAPDELPAAVAAVERKRVLRIADGRGAWALTFAMLSFFGCCGVGHLVGAVLAADALRIYVREGEEGRGRASAIVALALSGLGLALTAAALLWVCG